MMRVLLCCLSFLSWMSVVSGQTEGIIQGSVADESKKALAGVNVTLITIADTLQRSTVVTSKEGEFIFQKLGYGYYRLQLSYTGMQATTIDSIHVRKERSDFNLGEILMKSGIGELGEVIVYAEKPLIQSKDGNITFNAGESALAAGSNASDLLNNVPLVSKDPNGKITVRGKEPRILIDDKPVELNLQQLQDLLESLPGSSIEKIEVMLNPPPQYANEQGGVINITTKKGKVGKSGRVSLSGGTRREMSLNGSFNYRKKGLALTITTGTGYNRVRGEGETFRTNYYKDSSNFFNTSNNYLNKSWRPNLRVNLDYDLNKNEALNVVLQYNQNNYNNNNSTQYTNLNRFSSIYRSSRRNIHSDGENYTPNLTVSYAKKNLPHGGSIKLIAGANLSFSNSDRDFFQQFFTPDLVPNGIDSTQQQLNNNKNNGYNFRADYNQPLANKKTSFNIGSFIGRTNSDVNVEASYLRKPDMVMVRSDLLSNNFKFHQTIYNLHGSVRQVLMENFSITMGTAVEQTSIWFELFKENRDAKNKYITWLPFANINRSWKNSFSLTLAYRRSIRRPGINELNPTIDFGDPYNIRFGNENLEASTAHNFDFVAGKTKQFFYLNAGLGYNIVENIYSQVRTLLPDGKTQITWENISGRKEYEVSTWGGATITKKLKTNLSASYIFNAYSSFDKQVNRYRNGGSFTSNINATYTPKDVMNVTGSFTFNRFANPQGYARWNWSMNLGLQRKFFRKRLTTTINFIDPFVQRTRTYTYGTNFDLRTSNLAQTRNIRLTVAYNLKFK